MGDYDSVLKGVNEANAGGSRLESLPVGTHNLVLKGMSVGVSKKDGNTRVEGEFLVAESTSAKANETLGWVWFTGSKGFAGAYAKTALKEFLAAGGECIGDARDPESIGADFLCPAQKARGLNICAVIKHSHKKDKDGKPYLEISWKPVTQTLEQVAATRAELDAMDGATPVIAAPAPAPMAPPPVAPRVGGILAGLRK